MKSIRRFISVYKHTKTKKTWRADFNSYKEALKYRDSLKDKENYFLYEGWIETELSKPILQERGLKVEAIYFTEATTPIEISQEG